jgi:phage portal protein BeeE
LGIAAWLKTQFTRRPFQQATAARMGVLARNGAKIPRFDPKSGLGMFGSWCYAAAVLNANAFAGVPLRLYVRRRTGKKLYRTRPATRRRRGYLLGDGEHRPSKAVLAKVADLGDDFEEVTEPHPALMLLSTANAWQNGFELSALRLLYLQLTGNAYLHPVFSRGLGIPSELWPMPSQFVRVVPGAAGDADFVKGYRYGIEPDAVPFAPDEVIPFRLPNPADLYYGMGKVEAAWADLTLDRAKRVHDVAYEQNMGRPDWLIMVKGATEDTLTTIEEALSQKLRGPENAGKALAINAEAADAKALNFDQKEIGSPDKVIETIAAVFGVPLYKLRGNDPVKANSEVQDTGWMRDTILHYCRQDEEVLNASYLPLFGIEEDSVLAYDDPVGKNQTAEVERFAKLVGSSIMPNEARAEMGYDPADGGDILWAPKGSIPLAQMEAATAADIEATKNPPQPPAGQQQPPKGGAGAKALGQPTPYKDAEVPGGHADLAAVLRTFFAQQADEIVAGLPDFTAKGFAADILSRLSAWNGRLAAAAHDALSRIARTAAATLAGRLGLTHAVAGASRRQVDAAADLIAYKFAKSVNRTTAQRVAEATQSVPADAPDRAGAAKAAVRQVFADAAGQRAETIAETEGLRAKHTAEVIAADAAGVRLKSWVLSAEPCPTCVAIAATTEGGIPLDEAFSQDDYGPVEVPPAHVNCRCSVHLHT